MTVSFCIHENVPSYIDHDRLFKELIQTFFQEFVEAFFTQESAYIDFSNIKFLAQEVFTDILKGEKRKVDILAEAKLKEDDALILVHIEPQSYFQKEFHERMFIYCSRLYEKYRKPILPIAVFSYNDRKEVPEQFIIAFPTFDIIQFRYLALRLIKMDWRNYLRFDNPVTAALLSKMGYTEQERIRVKLEFLKIISRMELDPARTDLIYGFFETYLKLNEEEERQMREEIEKLPQEEAQRLFRLPNSYFEKGYKEGVEQEKEKMICEMLKKGLAAELIAEIAHLSIDKVMKMKDRLGKTN